MSLIILDVGTHDGHTMEEIVKSKYKFDIIYGFEPMPKQFQNVQDRFDSVPNVKIFNYGLSNESNNISLYGDNNNLGASIYPNKRDVDENIITACDVVSASSFFKTYISHDDIVIMKLNCEGSEIPILNDLLDTGEIFKITNVMIDFDIRKVSGMEHEESNLINRMVAAGFDNYCFCDDVMKGPTHQDRIANWLSTTKLDIYK